MGVALLTCLYELNQDDNVPLVRIYQMLIHLQTWVLDSKAFTKNIQMIAPAEAQIAW